MFERTLTLTSGGKTFTNTGWRIGWVIAPEPLLWPLAAILAPGQVSVATPMQIGFAMGFETEFSLWGKPNSHFKQIRTRAMASRDLLVCILRSVGAQVIKPTAGYAVVANFTQLVDQVDSRIYRDSRPGLALYKYLLISEVSDTISTFKLTMLYNYKSPCLHLGHCHLSHDSAL